MANNIITIDSEQFFVEDKAVIEQVRQILKEHALKVAEGDRTALGDELVVEIETTGSIHSKYSDRENVEEKDED